MTRAPKKPKAQHLDEAQAKTDQVQRELEVASAELGLAHGALERHLPPEAKKGDVEWAIRQNAEVEKKVREAANDLEEVSELLHQAKTA